LDKKDCLSTTNTTKDIMADQNENLHTLLNQVFEDKLGLREGETLTDKIEDKLEDKLGLREGETLTDKMNQVFEDKLEDKLGLREGETLTDKMNQVFEDKLQIAEGESVNLPNVEHQVGLLLGATPDAILQKTRSRPITDH